MRGLNVLVLRDMRPGSNRAYVFSLCSLSFFLFLFLFDSGRSSAIPPSLNSPTSIYWYLSFFCLVHVLPYDCYFRRRLPYYIVIPSYLSTSHFIIYLVNNQVSLFLLFFKISYRKQFNNATSTFYRCSRRINPSLVFQRASLVSRGNLRFGQQSHLSSLESRLRVAS